MKQRDAYAIYYLRSPRHWDPQSEKFTGVDSLVTAIQNGWEPAQSVTKREFYRGNSRPIGIYYVNLEKNGENVTMAVIGNPYLHKLLALLEISIVKQQKDRVQTPA